MASKDRHDLADLSNWREIHGRYSYECQAATLIYERIAWKGHVRTHEDRDIANAITLWKNNRVVHMTDETIRHLNAVTEKVQSPSDARPPEVASLLESLLGTTGIGLPVASTILKFHQPEVFPIIDQRAYRQVFGKTLSAKAGAREYFVYLDGCARLADQFGIPLRKVDEVLEGIATG